MEACENVFYAEDSKVGEHLSLFGCLSSNVRMRLAQVSAMPPQHLPT